MPEVFDNPLANFLRTSELLTTSNKFVILCQKVLATLWQIPEGIGNFYNVCHMLPLPLDHSLQLDHQIILDLMAKVIE